MTASIKPYGLLLPVIGLLLFFFHGQALCETKCIEGDCQNGAGILISSNGDQYNGDFKDGLMDGKGVFTWQNGNRYEGEFLGGERDGQGVFTWGNGNKYSGGFRAGKRDGLGTFTRRDGHKYVGGYRNGLKHGDGVFTSPEGDRYEGTFSDGMMDGEGAFTWANGDTYVGDFSSGLMHGMGTYTLASGESYTGSFINDHMDGEGTFAWNNGDYYTGEMSYQKQGMGTLTTREGKKIEGSVQVGAKIVEILPDSQAEQSKLLLVGDIITEYRRLTLVGGAGTLSRMVGMTRPYEQVHIKLLRDGQTQGFEINGGRIGVKLIDYPVFKALEER